LSLAEKRTGGRGRKPAERGAQKGRESVATQVIPVSSEIFTRGKKKKQRKKKGMLGTPSSDGTARVVKKKDYGSVTLKESTHQLHELPFSEDGKERCVRWRKPA